MECLVFSLFQMRIRLKQKTETNNTAKVNKSRIVQNRNYCQWIKINPENYNFHSLTFTGHFFYNSFKHLTFLFPRFFVVQISREPRAKKGHKGSVCIVLYMQSKKVTTTSTTRPWRPWSAQSQILSRNAIVLNSLAFFGGGEDFVATCTQ